MPARFALAALFALSACSKPTEGGRCEANKGTCLDKENALVCMNGTFTKVQCRKTATGCMETLGTVACDVVKDVGAPCSGEKRADCSTDGKKMLACENGAWALTMSCSKLCVSNVKGVRCENAEGAAGDPCTQQQFDQAVCSADKQTLLVCDGQKFFAASSCRGQNHCRAVNKNIDCDTSLAEVGDPCEEEGQPSCDVARKTLLKCVGKQFVKDQSCRKRCNNAFKKFSCD